MDRNAALLPAVVACVIGIGVGWFIARRGDEPTQPPSEEHAEAPEDVGEAPGLGTDRARLEAARAQLAEEVRRREGAEAALEEARTKLAALEPEDDGPSGAAPDKEGKGARFDYQAFSSTLSQIDWHVAGQAISRMSPLLAELATTIKEGKPIPPSVGDIQKYNGPLVKVALTAQQEGMPGTGTNGAFTHPSILANLVYSTLLEAGKPLSPGQEARLQEIADEAVAADARRLEGYGPETLALQEVWDETRLKDRFYEGVDGLVTDEQREILHPEALRGRVSFDLFSSGLVWMGVMAPQRYNDVDALRARLASQVTMRFGVPEDLKSVVEDVVGEWIAAFPRGYLDAPSDPLELGGRLKIERVRVAAEVQLRMLRALIDRLPAGSPVAEKIRAEPTVAVPVKVP